MFARHVLTAALLSAALGPLVAQAATPKAQAEALVEALLKDQNLGARAGEQLTFVVVYNEQVPASVEAKTQMVDALQEVTRWRVRHVKVAILEMAYANAGRMVSAIRARDLDVVVVAPGLDAELTGILAATRATKARSVGLDPAYARAGISLSLDGTKIVIGAAQAEGEGISMADAVAQR